MHIAIFRLQRMHNFILVIAYEHAGTQGLKSL